MPSATGSNAYIALIKQVPATPLVMPATPALQKVAFSSADLGADISTTESKNIKGNRRLADLTITGFSVGGGFDFEMTYESSLDDELMLGALMCEAWTLDVAKDGSFYQPFYIERGHSDVTEYFKYFGMVVNEWMMKYSDQSLVESSFKFIGLQEEVGVASVGATYTEAVSNDVFSTVTNVSNIKIDGVASGECEVKEWDITLNNNITGKTGVGVMGACSTNAHGVRINGKITMYFSDSTMYARLKAGTSFSFEWTVTDAAGQGYTFLLPKLKLDTDTIPIGGQDDDIMDDASFVALADSVTGCAMQVTRIP